MIDGRHSLLLVYAAGRDDLAMPLDCYKAKTSQWQLSSRDGQVSHFLNLKPARLRNFIFSKNPYPTCEPEPEFFFFE